MRLYFLFILSIVISLCSFSKSEKVIVGTSPTLSSAGIFIALEKGFFKDENLDVDINIFSASSAPMVPLVAKNKIDIGAGNVTSGLINARNEGLNIKIVADKGSVRKNAEYIRLILRTDLLKMGKYKSLKDLKGKKISFTSEAGTSQEAAFAKIIATAGLHLKDITIIKLSYSEANVALKNGIIDGTMQLEPYLSEAIKEGYASEIANVYNFHPDQQSGILFFSPGFHGKKQLAVKFLKAYIKGCRYYSKAFNDKRNSNEFKDVVEILQKWIGIKNVEQYRTMNATGFEENLRVNSVSLLEDIQYFYNQKYIRKIPNLEELIDSDALNQAISEVSNGR